MRLELNWMIDILSVNRLYFEIQNALLFKMEGRNNPTAFWDGIRTANLLNTKLLESNNMLIQFSSTHYATQNIANTNWNFFRRFPLSVPALYVPNWSPWCYERRSDHSQTVCSTKGDVITCVNKWSSYHPPPPQIANPHGHKLANLPAGMRLIQVRCWLPWWEITDNIRCVNPIYN